MISLKIYMPPRICYMPPRIYSVKLPILFFSDVDKESLKQYYISTKKKNKIFHLPFSLGEK
jgi:hypothetical protein